MKNFTDEELDTEWRRLRDNGDDMAVSLDAERQRHITDANQTVAELRDLARLRLNEPPKTARVIQFKESGKYYTEADWRIPDEEEVIAKGGTKADLTQPSCMKFSPDFKRVAGVGPVLVISQEPWEFPHLLVWDGNPFE